jgi:hypothetical protein
VAVRRSDLVAVMVLFATINLAMLAINGVRIGGDSSLYLDGADRVLAGQPLVDRQPSYFGYVVVVAASQAIRAGTTGVVMLQLLLASMAAAVVYLIGAALAGRPAGVLAAVLYSVDADTNRWHQFILADSIYISLFVVGVLLTHRAALTRAVEPVITAIAVVIASGLVRPEGWFLLPAVIAYIIFVHARSTAQRLIGAAAMIGAAVMLVLVLAPFVGGNLQAVGPANMLQRGQTIWEFDGWRVEMPIDGAAANGQAGAAIGYAMRHPISTIELMLARVVVHFTHVRPFYSRPHNIAIIAWLVPVYAATGFAIRTLGFTPLVSWIVIAIATQTAVVGLTHAEWDGRYLAHVLPLIDTLAAAGIVLIVRRRTTMQVAHA